MCTTTTLHKRLLRYMDVRISAAAHETTSVPATSSSKVCPKCGATSKSGKRSCCARGGAWFKNCGDAGDTEFGHTWAEGIQTCEHSGNLDVLKSPRQVMLRHAGVVDCPLDLDRPCNATKRRKNTHDPVRMSNVGITDSGFCVGVAKATVRTCTLFIMLYIRM